MDKQALEHYWRGKSDTELIQALNELDAYEEDARIVIQGEALGRPEIDRQLINEPIDEKIARRQEAEDEAKATQDEQRQKRGCLRLLYVVLVISIPTWVVEVARRLSQRDHAGVVGVSVIPILLLIWIIYEHVRLARNP